VSPVAEYEEVGNLFRPALLSAQEVATINDDLDRIVANPESPGLVLDDSGEAAPASHVNFVIANEIVVMPTYGTATVERAAQALQAEFPDRKVVCLPSRGVLGSGLAGGGSFHCITREEPL